MVSSVALPRYVHLGKKRVRLQQFLEFTFWTPEHLLKMNHFLHCWNPVPEMLHCLSLFISFEGISVSNYLLWIGRVLFVRWL